MSKLAIERRHLGRNDEAGNALLSTVVVLTGLLGLLYAASAASVIEVKESKKNVDDVRAKYLADAGVESAINFLSQASKKNFQNPMQELTNLFVASPTMALYVAQPVMNGTTKVGAYSVSMTSLQQTASSITIAIDATGYLPDAPSALPAGKNVAAWRAQRTTVQYSLAPSQVFDYAYFINNWGWFYGDTIRCYGNVRSNGQFDAAGYAPTITGQPTYDSVAWNEPPRRCRDITTTTMTARATAATADSGRVGTSSARSTCKGSADKRRTSTTSKRRCRCRTSPT